MVRLRLVQHNTKRNDSLNIVMMVQQCLKEHGNNFVAIDGEIKVNNWVQHNT